MDDILAFALGAANRKKELMVFDWDKAAKLIKELKPKWAYAGLRGDEANTEGCIYGDGEPIFDDYTFLASTWAVPQLAMPGYVEVPCFKMKHEVPDWDSDTKWPDSAIRILSEQESGIQEEGA